MDSTSILSEKWARIGRKLWIKLDGRPKLKTKWSFCVSLIKKYFEFGASALYVQNVSEDDQVKLVTSIVDYIRKAFLQIIQSNNWMDEETKKEAIIKTDKIRLHVGFPSELLNDSAINQVYEWAFHQFILLILCKHTGHSKVENGSQIPKGFLWERKRDSEWIYTNLLISF